MVHAGIPDDLSPGRPRWRRWRRPRPRRSPVAGRTAVVVVPVTAVVPVLVGAPARVPLFARAPVVVIHRRRRRRRRSSACGQSECGQGQTACGQRTRTQPNPRSWLRVGIHPAVLPRGNACETLVGHLLMSNVGHSGRISAAKLLGVYRHFVVIFLAPGDGIADRAKQFLTAIFGLRAGSNAKSNAPVDFPKAMTPVNDDEAPAVGGVEAHVNGGHAVVVRRRRESATTLEVVSVSGWRRNGIRARSADQAVAITAAPVWFILNATRGLLV